MVKMSMGANQRYGFQLLFLHVTANSRTLFRIKGTAVNEEALFRLVAYHIAVHSEHIAYKPLNLQHFTINNRII